MIETRLRLIITILISLTICNAHAVTFQGTIKGNGSMQWNNVIKRGSNVYTTSNSDIASNLKATKKWIPLSAQVAPHSGTTITLTHTNGTDTVVAPISFYGTEYIHSGIFNSTTGTGGVPGAICSEGSHTSKTIEVRDSNNMTCKSIFALESSTAKTPFYFTRPIIKASEASLIAAFKNKPAGQYNTILNWQIRYYYYTNSNILTYRDIAQTLAISIYNEGIHLSNVHVTGDGVLTPIYNTVAQSVSSSTTYNITANGYFDNGLKMQFLNRKYQLVNSLAKDKFINYSINCTGCLNTKPIVDGVLKATNGLVKVSTGTNKDKINFQLIVSYKDIGFTQVETGTYTDSFIIIFEADL